MKGAGINCVSVERASAVGVLGSWTIELEWEALGGAGKGRLVLIMKVFGFQSNGTNVDGSWLVGRRGTMDPLQIESPSGCPIRTEAYTEFSFGFSVCSGVVFV